MSRHHRAMLACAEWLAYCLEIGWLKSQLDDLERLWWQYHDDQGNLIRGGHNGTP